MSKLISEWTFDDDKLHMENYADQLTEILFNFPFKITEHKGLSIALDSAWGTGKTTFIHMWKNKLIKDDKIKIVYYNSWENDDYDCALIPLISEIYKDKKTGTEIAKKTAKIIYTTLGIGARQIISNKIGIDTEKIAKEIEKVVVNNVTRDYKEYQEKRNDFKKEFAKIIPQDGKLLVFIDELDRCRPKFAIDTLEAIKHFFDIDNLTFIFSLDFNQLAHSISTLYGQNMDSYGYLARFFDLQFKIPTPSYLEYTQYLLTNYNFPISPYSEVFSKISSCLKLSLREMNHIINNVLLFISIYGTFSKSLSNKNITFEIYAFLIALKYKNPKMLYVILHEPYLNFGSKTSKQVVTIDDFYFSISDNISDFLHSFELGHMNYYISEIEKSLRLISVDTDYYPTPNIENEPVYKYIERKMEFLNLIKSQD